MAIIASDILTISSVSDGDDGAGIASTKVEYQAGSSGTSAPTGTWSTSIPATSASAPYLWTRVTYTYTDGSSPKIVYSVGSTPEGAIESANSYTDSKIETVSSALDASNDVIVGTQTAVTGSWTGKAKFAELKDGQRIAYWLPYNGSGNATLNLTLSTGSTTGAINCYYSGASRITTHYPAGNVIHLTYKKNISIAGSSTKYTGWWADANYDSNTYDRTVYSQAIKAGSTAIVAGNLIVGKDGVYTHLKLGSAFDVNYPILYASANLNAGAASSWRGYLAIPFTVTTTQSITLTTYKPVYIKGKLSGSLFTPVSTAPLTQTVPATEDGYQYILLGTAYSTTGLYLLNEHPIFQYHNGAFKTTTQIATEAYTKAHNAQLNIDTANGRIDTLVSRTDSLGQSLTSVTQTADKINWLVKSGTSSTDFTLTDRTASLITDSLVIKDSTGSATIISGGTINVDNLYSKTAKFGNWSLSLEDDGLVGTNGNINTYVLAGTNNNSDFLVVKNGDTYPFYVKTDGSIHAKELGTSYIRCDGNVNVNGTLYTTNIYENGSPLSGKYITGMHGPWLPENGYNMFTACQGKTLSTYSVHPSNMIAQGCPPGLVEYGTVITFGSPTYPIMLYVDVYGNHAFYNTNMGKWNNGGCLELWSDTPYIDFHFNKSTADYTSRIIEPRQGVLEFNNILVVGSNITRPYGDNTVLLGTSQYRWAAVYSVIGTIQTSDEREKDIIGSIDDRYLNFFEATDPILYRWKYGDDKRIRIGIGAQTAEKNLFLSGLSFEDYAGIYHDYFDEPTSNGLTDRYGMDYSMYCLLAAEQTKRNTKKIRTIVSKQSTYDARMDSLQTQLSEAMNEIAELKKLIKIYFKEA